MGFKEQLKTIKENWLIALVVLILVLVLLFSGSVSKSFASGTYLRDTAMSVPMAESAAAKYGGGYYPSYNENFAPEVTNRKITKSASLTNEVERGKFQDAETKLKAIVKSSDSFLLNENSYKYGEGRTAYLSGNYQIKVETKKYELVAEQLKEIGEVQSFSENARDITGSYTDLNVELEAEKSRLKKYQEMYESSSNINDKITLTDKIFELERTISYLEDSLKNMDQRVDYSTIYVTLNEEQSGYAEVILVKFSALVSGLVNSFNNVLKLLFWAVPWAVAIGLIWLIVKVVRRKR